MLMYYFTSAVKNAQLHVDDDIIDKLNYHYTSSILLVFAILVSTKQYIGHPIQCWVPATFTEPMEQYIENYCWIQNTYYIPIQESIPKEEDQRVKRNLGYYQWVPFVLALQALMFYVPCIIWRLICWQSGINVQSLVQMACDSRMLDSESRQRAVTIIANHVEDALTVKPVSKGNNKRLLNKLICSGNTGSSVTCLYMFTKILYSVNIVIQLYLINIFLHTKNFMFGFQHLEDLLYSREWDQSGHFPRVTLCDFEVKVVANVHRHTVQCVLMINMFNEKIFLFLWFWYVLLFVSTMCSFVHWSFISIFAVQRAHFIGRYLSGLEGYRMVDSHALEKFTVNLMKHDGVFLLRMVAMHAGDLICCELTKTLWNSFCDYKESSRHEHEKRFRQKDFGTET